MVTEPLADRYASWQASESLDEKFDLLLPISRRSENRPQRRQQ